MSARFPWWWVVPSAGFTLLAVANASTYAVAIPAATAAVVLAGIAVAETLARLPRPTAVRVAARSRAGADVRSWLGAGRVGREDLLLFLDRMERRSTRPELPNRNPAELDRLLRLSQREFLRYLAEQLVRLEGAT